MGFVLGIYGAAVLAFSLFVALETWLTPFEGWIVDFIGPRREKKGRVHERARPKSCSRGTEASS